MKFIINQSQLKKIIVEEKKQLNESIGIMGVIGLLSLGTFAASLVWELFKKLKKGLISKKHFNSEVKKIKKRDDKGYYDEKSYEKNYYNDQHDVQSYSSGIDKKNIVIGDPQASVIAGKSRKGNLIGRKSGESTLWKPGADVNWLISSVKKFPKSPKVNNVIICIGTNGGFNPSDNVSGLFSVLYDKFPKANFYTVQGSWGKGANTEIELYNVERYYHKFEKYSNIIGSVGDISKLKLNPHSPKIKSYDEIANEIDRLL